MLCACASREISYSGLTQLTDLEFNSELENRFVRFFSLVIYNGFLGFVQDSLFWGKMWIWLQQSVKELQ